MIIAPPPHFQHAGDLSARVDSADPREHAFPQQDVVVDLRGCEFVRTAAVLWCLVYLLLGKSRGAACQLLVPTNMGVCTHLKSTGLFEILQQEAVEVDDRGILTRPDSQLILPLTKFESEGQVEQVTNDAHDALLESRLGAANLYPLVSEVFAELAMNAVQHAGSSVGAYGLVQFYSSPRGERFVCGVADGGIGIRRSLEKNPALRERLYYDWDAIELATRERVSGTLDKTRGIGLYGVAEDMRRAGRQLIIHSGIGSLQISEDMQSEALRTRLFPGTLAYASIPS